MREEDIDRMIQDGRRSAKPGSMASVLPPRTAQLDDMHPDTALVVCRHKDGDISVAIGMWPSGMPYPLAGTEMSATVEFCAGLGGGRSKRTHAALAALLEAMVADQENMHAQ